jgi:hypothetical protein
MRDDGLEIIRRCEGEKVHTQVQFFFSPFARGLGCLNDDYYVTVDGN